LKTFFKPVLSYTCSDSERNPVKPKVKPVILTLITLILTACSPSGSTQSPSGAPAPAPSSAVTGGPNPCVDAAGQLGDKAVKNQIQEAKIVRDNSTKIEVSTGQNVVHMRICGMKQEARV
jgi:hypothetical protein